MTENSLTYTDVWQTGLLEVVSASVRHDEIAGGTIVTIMHQAKEGMLFTGADTLSIVTRLDLVITSYSDMTVWIWADDCLPYVYEMSDHLNLFLFEQKTA